MIARLRPLVLLCLVCLLAACASSSNSVGELPRTPQASIDQLLQEAGNAQTEEANLLRLSAADLAFKQKDYGRSSSILQQVQLETLKPAQQIFASTLNAELALVRKNPKAALEALNHPSFQRLGELPVEQQVRSQLTRATALEQDGQTLAAARERIYIAPLLTGATAASNHETIWELVSRLPADQLQATGDADLTGWLALVAASKSASTVEQQKAAIDNWVATHPAHPAATNLPQPLKDLQQLSSKPLGQIALLLPQEGKLANVGRALRDGFMAAYYQAQQNGETLPQVQVYDSSRLSSMDSFYQQAQSAGVQLVVGPLEKELVTQLNGRQQLPITTLALNYSQSNQEGPAELFQYGLAAEDEAREAARRAWSDGMRRAVALAPSGDWGNRVLAAFRESFEGQGGEVVASEAIAQPVELAQQIAKLLQLRQSEARSKSLQDKLGTTVDSQPARRQDIDFMFLAATPQQAQQIKPTLVFQYAGDMPVYATSTLYTGNYNQAQYLDFEGIMFCETPWLLNVDDPMRQQVVSQWPQAGGSLGRLYAMGADAFTLAPRLSQLKALPNTRIDGLTGSLSLSPGQRVVRQLPWAKFSNGQIQQLPDTPLD